MSVPVIYHSSQWPTAVAAQVRTGLLEGTVPGRLLYDSFAQAARWLAYHEGWSPARTAESVQGLYDTVYAAVLDELPPGPIQYVSLGCGGGQKDARWIRQANRPSRVVLTDTSAALTLTAGQAVAEAGATDVHQIVLDLTAWPARSAYGVTDEWPVVWSCLGMLPNFEHHRLLPYLADLMGPADRVIVSANLSPDPFAASRGAIMPQYDNALARTWYDGALVELGLSLSTTDRRLVAAALEPDGSIWRMRYVATPREPAALNVHGALVTIDAGTELQVFQSTRYTPERVERLWSSAGLTQRATAVDEGREEGVYALARAPS